MVKIHDYQAVSEQSIITSAVFTRIVDAKTIQFRNHDLTIPNSQIHKSDFIVPYHLPQ